MIDCTFEEIINLESKIKFEKNDTYIITYPIILDFFKTIKEFNPENSVICSSIIYSWMPTILKINLSNSDKIPALLNKAKNNEFLFQNELEILKIFINNSIVGSSKLLHFINPEKYPIWDKRVCSLFFKKPHGYIVNNSENYIKYIELCERIICNNSFMIIKKSIENKIGYSVSNMRAIEMIFYMGSKYD